jgi:uncharacterized protein YybS (DUF2232 family)
MSGSFDSDRTTNNSEHPNHPSSQSMTPHLPSDDTSLSEGSDPTDEDPLAALAAVTDEVTVESGDRVSPIRQPIRQIDPSSLVLVETAFLASTASLLWLASYYLSLIPWMRIIFPIPIALAYLRWGQRAAWMSALVTGLLLSVLMGPYLSVLFLIPYGFLGVQLGALWHRRAPWSFSIATGTLISTLGFFFRLWLLSIFLNEDLWTYLTSRITDFVTWVLTQFFNWGWLGIRFIEQIDVRIIQAVTVGVVLLSDVVYLFTIHLAAWLLLERLGNPIPEPPRWVQVLLEEE